MLFNHTFPDGDGSKRQALEQAKVVYLLYNHSLSTPEIFKSHCQLHEQMIRDLYRDGDIILLEEDSELKGDQLVRNFIPTLNRSKYRAKGWDVHELCEKTHALYELEYRVNKAIGVILSDNALSKNNREAWETVLNFAKVHCHGELSEADIDNYLNDHLSRFERLKFEQKIKLVSMKCRIELEKLKINHIYDTFQQRQDALARSIQKNSLKYGKIFVLAGRNHANPTDEKIKPIIENHFQQLTASYVVVDPEPFFQGVLMRKS